MRGLRWQVRQTPVLFPAFKRCVPQRRQRLSVMGGPPSRPLARAAWALRRLVFSPKQAGQASSLPFGRAEAGCRCSSTWQVTHIPDRLRSETRCFLQMRQRRLESGPPRRTNGILCFGQIGLMGRLTPIIMAFLVRLVKSLEQRSPVGPDRRVEIRSGYGGFMSHSWNIRVAPGGRRKRTPTP